VVGPQIVGNECENPLEVLGALGIASVPGVKRAQLVVTAPELRLHGDSLLVRGLCVAELSSRLVGLGKAESRVCVVRLLRQGSFVLCDCFRDLPGLPPKLTERVPYIRILRIGRNGSLACS